MNNNNQQQALYTLVIVFFFWGFIAASNGVFIPFCKKYFVLDQFQSQLIEFAFYGAYYVGALFLFESGNKLTVNKPTFHLRPMGKIKTSKSVPLNK